MCNLVGADENPEKLVGMLNEIMLCKGPNKCLSNALKQKAEFEQVKVRRACRWYWAWQQLGSMAAMLSVP